MAGGTSEGANSKPAKKRVLLIAAAVLVAVGAGGSLWAGGFLGHGKNRQVSSAATTVQEKPVLVDLPDLVSNLDTGGHRASFVKVHAKLQVRSQADAIVLLAAIPLVTDVFHPYLRSTRPDELRGGEGTYRLREALMNRVDAILSPVELTDLLFTEILVQ